MKSPISPRDIELLSAYLDQQLDSSQLVKLETRLKSDPELHQLYQELRRTRQLLRSAPPLKAPRKFILTPNLAGVHPARRVYPAFQFASAIAGLLLVITLLGDFLGLRGLAPVSFARDSFREEVSAEATVEVEALSKMAPEQGITDTQVVTEELPLVVAVPGSTAAGVELPAEAMPTPTIATGLEALILETPTPTVVPPSAQETAPPEGLALVPAISGGEAQDMTPVQPPASEARPGPVYWRIVEISLALLAVGCGLAAVYIRRRGFR